MGNGYQIDPSKPTIIGNPIHPISGDDVQIVEGTLGNPVFLNDDDLNEFDLLVVAKAGQKPEKVAKNLANNHKLSIRPFIPEGEKPDPKAASFKLKINPKKSHHYLDQEIREKLRFRPDLKHLKAIFGEKADFYTVSCSLPYKKEKVFPAQFPRGKAGGNYVNTRKFDLIQKSADGVVETLHRGGFAIFDRQDADGKPDSLYGALLSDIHAAFRNDEMEAKIILKLKDKYLFLRFNNPNANFEAMISWVNEQYRLGQLDWATLLGDNVDFDGRFHEGAKKLTDSNNYLLAKFLNRIEAPVFVTRGNHEYYPEGAPAEITPANYDLAKEEVRRLEADRYGDGSDATGFTGRLNFLEDMIDTIMNDPNTLISYSDTINPFSDIVIDFGKGDPQDPLSKKAMFVMTEMGGNDLAHFRQDDSIYLKNRLWVIQPPLIHPPTIVEAFLHGSPDLLGPTTKQLPWLASQVFQEDSNLVFLMHPALLNSRESQVPYNSDPKFKITPLQPAGEYEDLTFNTIAHGEDLLSLLAYSPSVRAVIGGHAHFDGAPYMMGFDLQGDLQIYRGPVGETLDRLDPSNASLIHNFWFPKEECLDGCSPEVSTLYGDTVETIRNKKFTWQVGNASRGLFYGVTLNPEGLISHVERFYVNKVLKQDPKNPASFAVEYEVGEKRLPNNRLIAEWAALKEKHPEYSLDWEQAAKKIFDRLSPDATSFIPRPDSLKDYPKYNDIIEHPYISPTKISPWYKFRGTFNAWPEMAEAGPRLAGQSWQLSYEYLFDQYWIGGIQRAIMMEGPEFGVSRDETGLYHAYAAWRSPTLIDWQMSEFSEHAIIRGIQFALGPEWNLQGDGWPDHFHNDLNLFELTYHEKGWEIFLGLDRRNFFAGEGAWWWIVGASKTFE